MPFRPFALQIAATILVLSLAWPYFGLTATPLPWRETALLIGGVAFFMAWVLRQPWWWRMIHAIFAPLAWVVSQYAIDPLWFLAAFIALLLVYRGALTGQVPLYLSGRATVTALENFFAQHAPIAVADLGAGLGSMLIPLSARFPDCHFVGVENAPLTWLIGKLRTLPRANVHWRWGDLWQTPLDEFELVYTFLSPAPMPRLWQKALAEMRPGALLVSNSFPIPDIEPDETLLVEGPHPYTLYVYRIPE